MLLYSYSFIHTYYTSLHYDHLNVIGLYVFCISSELGNNHDTMGDLEAVFLANQFNLLSNAILISYK